MRRVTDHLKRIGASIELKKNSFPPIKIKGVGDAIPLNYDIKIPSAQIKSAIMLSALNTNGIVKIKEFKSTRDHTENMLKAMGYNIKVKENSKYRFIEMKNDKDLTFKGSNKKSESNTERYKRIQKDNTKVIKGMIDKATEKKANGGRIGRKFGGGADMGSKKLSAKQMKIASLAGNKKKIDGPDFAKLRSKKA